MKVIVCLDKTNGMLFNRRRQSRDASVFQDMLGYTNTVTVSPFSEKLLSSYGVPHTVDESFPENVKDGYAFVENIPLLPYEESITEVIVYRWDKIYPADTVFDLPLTKYRLISTEEFSGNSHKTIVKETYLR